MNTEPIISDEESLALFMQYREEAMASILFTFPAYKADRVFVRKWRDAGWIEPTGRSDGQWRLVERYRAYGPMQPRVMEPSEYELYLEAARASINEVGIIKVLEFAKLAPREGLYRLVEAEFVFCKRQEPRNKIYILKTQYWKA